MRGAPAPTQCWYYEAVKRSHFTTSVHWKGGLEVPSSCFIYHRESKRAFLQHQGGSISTCMVKWTKGECVSNDTGMMKQFVSNATKLDFELIVIPVSTLPSLHTPTVECDTVWNPTESAASALLCHQHPVCLGMFTGSKSGAANKDIRATMGNPMNSDCGSGRIRSTHCLFICLSYATLNACWSFIQPPSSQYSVVWLHADYFLCNPDGSQCLDWNKRATCQIVTWLHCMQSSVRIQLHSVNTWMNTM